MPFFFFILQHHDFIVIFTQNCHLMTSGSLKHNSSFKFKPYALPKRKGKLHFIILIITV